MSIIQGLSWAMALVGIGFLVGRWSTPHSTSEVRPSEVHEHD